MSILYSLYGELFSVDLRRSLSALSGSPYKNYEFILKDNDIDSWKSKYGSSFLTILLKYANYSSVVRFVRSGDRTSTL